MPCTLDEPNSVRSASRDKTADAVVLDFEAIGCASEAATAVLDGLRDVALSPSVVSGARSRPSQPRPTDVGVHDEGMR